MVIVPGDRDRHLRAVFRWGNLCDRAVIGIAGGLVATAYYYLLENSMHLVWHQVPEMLRAWFPGEFLVKNYVWIAASIGGLLVGMRLKVAVTYPGGTHDLWMRYWLAPGGINPDTDVSMFIVPPPQMVANMKAGTMHAFCVGEPWNAQLIL